MCLYTRNGQSNSSFFDSSNFEYGQGGVAAMLMDVASEWRHGRMVVVVNDAKRLFVVQTGFMLHFHQSGSTMADANGAHHSNRSSPSGKSCLLGLEQKAVFSSSKKHLNNFFHWRLRRRLKACISQVHRSADSILARLAAYTAASLKTRREILSIRTHCCKTFIRTKFTATGKQQAPRRSMFCSCYIVCISVADPSLRSLLSLLC